MAINRLGVIVVWCGLAFLTATAGVKAQATTVTPPSVDQLPSLVQAAKAVFVPRTQADLDRARAGVLEAMKALEDRLKTAGVEANDWRTYLMWDELQRQFSGSRSPNLDVLDKIYARFAAGHDGLELVWFENVREAMRQYLVTARAIGNQELPEQYRQLLDELAKHLEAYARNPNPDEASAVGTALDWLQSAGQAPQLIAAIRARWVQPNLFARASEEFIAAALVRAVDEVQPVQDCILGTAICGTGYTKGQAIARLVPNSERAQVEIVFQGTVNSNTIGYAERGVQVYSTGLTSLQTRKPVFIEPERIWAAPTFGDAQTSSSINDIEASRKIIERIAWRRASRQQPLANSIASEHAAQRASTQTDQQSDPQIADANQRYQKRFRKQLFERNLYPRHLRYFSTEEALHAVGLEAGAADLGAPTTPPPVAQPLDLTVQAHESLVNNMAEGMFAGTVMTEERFQANVTELLGQTPSRLRREEGEEPWTIIFAKALPICVHFTGQNELTVTVRGRAYERGTGEDKERYPGMNVTATYRLQATPQGIKAIRQGDLAIYPPGFQPGGARKLSVRQQVLRDLLKRRFDKLFDKEIRPDDIQLQGRDGQGSPGSLTLVNWEVAPGWMTLSWKRLPPSPAAPAVRPVSTAAPAAIVQPTM
jgi:hypothetical protein